MVNKLKDDDKFNETRNLRRLKESDKICKEIIRLIRKTIPSLNEEAKEVIAYWLREKGIAIMNIRSLKIWNLISMLQVLIYAC